MTSHEFFVRLLAVIKPAIPEAIAVLVISLAMFFVVALRSKGLWVNKPQFRRLGIFCELSKLGCLRLACAWIKLLVLAIYIVKFQKLEAVEYLLFIVPGLIYALFGDPRHLAGRLLWLILELAGLVSTNLVCGYYFDMRGGAQFIIIYGVMAIFMLLLAGYLFLTEVEDISEGRGAVKYEA